MIARYLRAVLGIISPSVLATVRRRDPEPRTWLARRERALALLWLGDMPSLAERAEAEQAQVAAYARAVEAIISDRARSSP